MHNGNKSLILYYQPKFTILLCFYAALFCHIDFGGIFAGHLVSRIEAYYGYYRYCNTCCPAKGIRTCNIEYACDHKAAQFVPNVALMMRGAETVPTPAAKE